MRCSLMVSIIAAFLATAALATIRSAAGSPQTRQLLESHESLYNNVYVYKENNYVMMTFGFNQKLYTESVYNTQDDRDLPVVYTRFMTEALIYPKKIERVLEIGFGGGRTSWYLHKFLPNVPVTSVELDPVVFEMARKYFGIKDEPNFTVANSDGRTFLKNSNDRYDVILIDAYRGPFVPFHLLTKEFYNLVKEHLAEGGVVAQNIEPTTMLFDSAVLTINSVFPELDFYLAEGNVVTVAYEKPLSSQELQQAAETTQKMFNFRYNLSQMLGERRRLNLSDTNIIDKKAKILTDDFAPVETLKAIEQHNRKWPEH